MTDLRALAEAATPEAWDLWDWASWREGDGDQAGRLTLDPYQSRENVALAVAASPDRILALLDERDRLRAALAGIVLRYHDLAISGDERYGDGDLHPSVTWERCVVPACVAARAALGSDR